MKNANKSAGTNCENEHKWSLAKQKFLFCVWANI